MVDLREEVVGPDAFCGDDACAREDQELAFFTFCSRTGDSYKVQRTTPPQMSIHNQATMCSLQSNNTKPPYCNLLLQVDILQVAGDSLENPYTHISPTVLFKLTSAIATIM
jgi:hypothetical protein